jgi:hypothetical protein
MCSMKSKIFVLVVLLLGVIPVYAFESLFDVRKNYEVGTGPFSVFCAGLDQDTDLDLAVANYFSDNISILKNLSGSYFVRGDANKDGNIDIGDVIYLINYLFKGGTPPFC